MKKTLENRIRAIAESGRGVGMPNWFNLAQFKDVRAKHIAICQKLTKLSDAHNSYPITYLVYFAVGKNAHRLPTFLSGYKKIDTDKAKKILSWLTLFANHENKPTLFRNANVMHALVRFYEKQSSDTDAFKAALNSFSCEKYTFMDVCKGLHITKAEMQKEQAQEVAVAVEA